MTIQDNSNLFENFMRFYYSLQYIRIIISLITFICLVTLALYLMILPIQIAYHNVITGASINTIQENIDILVFVFCSLHLFIYFDNHIIKVIKKSHFKPRFKVAFLGKWSTLLSIELFYDIVTWIYSIYMIVPNNNNFYSRFIELLFVLKVIKLYLYHKKIIFKVIGTVFYSFYLIFWTLAVIFIAASYIASIFYAMDESVYYNGPYPLDAWQVHVQSEPNLISANFWSKLLLSNYWAIGTCSTAAYGDVAAVQPDEIIYSILIMFFATFLWGFYTNNVQSLPLQFMQEQIQTMEKFNRFQKHNNLLKQITNQKDIISSSKNNQNSQLYLKILCSMQYQENERTAHQRIKLVIPQKYLQQINLEIYKEFINCDQFRSPLKSFFTVNKTTLKIAKQITEAVCQKNQNIYDYKNQIFANDLIYIHEGQIKIELSLSQLSHTVFTEKKSGQIFGQYNFIINSQIQFKALAKSYVTLYLIKRNIYKKILSLAQAKQFNRKFQKCLDFSEATIQDEVYKKYVILLKQKNLILDILDSNSKRIRIRRLLREKCINERKLVPRNDYKIKKIIIQRNNNKINAQCQTLQQNLIINFQTVLQL